MLVLGSASFPDFFSLVFLPYFVCPFIFQTILINLHLFCELIIIQKSQIILTIKQDDKIEKQVINIFQQQNFIEGEGSFRDKSNNLDSYQILNMARILYYLLFVICQSMFVQFIRIFGFQQQQILQKLQIDLTSEICQKIVFVNGIGQICLFFYRQIEIIICCSQLWKFFKIICEKKLKKKKKKKNQM
eukprot:TRINITY_DN85051_c0_g1_i1.p4 TRINITY_DN85051_c0_g1~~TRINITY_DN85051_c0_g1_i1.p4  ORF type:complete len:188 (-),score=6.30 TRINITY_DN85051_c0_g1_i1:37-600(-)